MDILYRSIQSLPPRELLMLFQTKCLATGQEEVSHLYKVRQSNVSFRGERSFVRIRLNNHLLDIVSETQLRRELVGIGLSEPVIRVVMGVCRTTSQSATAKAYSQTQGSIRHVFSTAVKRIRRMIPKSKTAELIGVVEKNYNQLRAIQTQKRWETKVGKSNYV